MLEHTKTIKQKFSGKYRKIRNEYSTAIFVSAFNTIEHISPSAQLKIIKFKNDFYVEYNINYLQVNYFFMKKITLTLINLTDPCTEIICTCFFDINMFSLSNLNKKYLIAKTKMNCVS